MSAYLVRFFTPPRPQGLCGEDNRAVHVVISAQLSAQLSQIQDAVAHRLGQSKQIFPAISLKYDFVF